MDIDFPEITRYLAQIQICGWHNKANEIGRDILNAFNEYDVDSDMEFLVTTRGQKVNSISWFIIDLYIEYSESWYIEANVEHTPKKKVSTLSKGIGQLANRRYARIRKNDLYVMRAPFG